MKSIDSRTYADVKGIVMLEYSIIRHIATIKKLGDISIQLNVVKWGDGEEKYDLRKWSGTTPGKGITLTEVDLVNLFDAIDVELAYLNELDDEPHLEDTSTNKEPVVGHFNPGLEIGETVDNTRLCSIFGCGPQGGMRKSNRTNTLIIVTNYTRGIYHDKWIGGVLHYTGMGLSGDQSLDYMQNKTLNLSGTNGVDVHLFEVMTKGRYIYCGRVELADAPYTESQIGDDGKPRKVWMFPVRPIPDNNVVKPRAFVYKDMDDYLRNGKFAEQRWEIERKEYR